MKRIVLLLLLLAPAFSGHAQVMPKAFSEDPVKFIQEMSDFFESYEKKEGREFIDEFNKTYWVTNKVNESMKQSVYKNCNLMLKKKFKPSPEYRSYFNTIKAVVDYNIPLATFNDWQVCFNKLAEAKTNKPLSDFIQTAEFLFSEGKFYKTASIEWRASGGTYAFQCDSIPQIRFTNVTLTALAKGDSCKIYNTSGVFYPTQGMWKGKGGRVDWQRCGIPAGDVYADIKTYSITVKSASYQADSAVFYNKTYFKEKPLIGKLSDKAVPDVTTKTANYPRFESYSSRYQIKGLFPNVDYEGGFSQIGPKFVGSGSKEEPAILVFKRNGKDFLRTKSLSYVFTKEKVTSQNSAIKFFLDQDSIVHTAIDFKFFIDTGRVELYRPNEGASQAPYYNSFHKVDMYVEKIIWQTNTSQIQMLTTPAISQGEADFPSSDYYRQYLYDKMQGMDAIHPLIKIRNYHRDNGNIQVFTVTDLSHYWKLGPEQLRPLMVNLANQGFILFDIQRDEITYKEKIDTYIAARAGKKDYDNIDFQSKVKPGSPNATLNLLNYDLTLYGVTEVTLSDSQNVTVFPAKDMLVLKKNRNFSFEGSILAGRFDYYGKLFTFDYETFKLNLNNVDSVRIWVDGPKIDENNKPIPVKVRSVIENMNGELKIDDPMNKSGIRSKFYAQYPIFTSAKPSFVYYDQKSVQRGVYNRDKFYFKLDPFTIDSLDNFNNQGLKFAGVFQSAGIFPEIRDSLRLQPDYSLGFVRQAPPGGYPLYGGKAKFTNEMRLSNKGLRGDGQIDYITSTSISKDFIFFPDSLNGTAQTFDIKPQKISGKTEYPTVTNANVYIHWMPKKDYMQITNKDSAFSMFEKKGTFKGTLTLSPRSLQGGGNLAFSNAAMDSKKMTFKNQITDADTADFRLRAFDLGGLAFSTNNVNAHVDFEKRQGDFKANGKGSLVQFPVNQYMCLMENFRWYMDKSEIDLNGAKQNAGSDKIDLDGPEFISTHPKQDSLRFRAPLAKYDLKNYVIYAKQVKEILIADARIIPDSGNVTIEKNAKMQRLENAKIEANAVTKYHKLFNCQIDVYSRKAYEANGDYAYIDELKKEQIIHFSKISPDTTGQTYAEGMIADSSRFMLSPAYDYNGKVILAANNEFLVFDGSTMLTHDCAIGKRRMMFRGEINPNQIYIPVLAEPTDEKNGPITAGIISTVDSTHIYGAFLSPRRGRTDVSVITADGFLFYDKAAREYRISNKEKLVERSLPGNYISLSTKNCSIYGEGAMNLGANLGLVTMTTLGNATHNTIDHSTSFDLVMGVDFFFDEKIMDNLIKDITASTSMAATEAARPTFQRALTELIGKEKADKLITQLNLYGQYKKFPDELKYTFFFTDVKMKWNQATKSYISEGKLGLGSIYKEQINKFVEGKIQLQRKKSGDVLHIYFELDGGKWYYFTYSNGAMLAVSSNDAFNTAIKEKKDDDRKKEGEKGQRYRYQLGNPNDKSLFLKRLQRAEEPTEDGSGEPK